MAPKTLSLKRATRVGRLQALSWTVIGILFGRVTAMIEGGYSFPPAATTS